MARVRSPNYPSISLPAALERIRKVHGIEGRNEVDRESFVQLIGYSSLSGPAAKTLSSLGKYGLTTKAGSGEVKVSDLAMDIMFGEPDDKAKAIRRAANSPSLFAEINEKWPERQPGDENLRSYLARKGFSMKALDQVINAYRETMSLVSDESGAYDSGLAEPDEGAKTEMHAQEQSAPRAGEPFRLSITGSRIEVSAALETPEQVDELMRGLKIARAMITPVGPASTEGEPAD